MREIAKADPAGGQVLVRNVATVGSTQLGGQDDGADEGEHSGKAVQEEEEDGHEDALDEGCKHAVEQGNPRPGSHEHGEVDGHHVPISVGGDDIADEGGDDQCPDQRNAAQDDTDELRHDGGEVCKETVLLWIDKRLIDLDCNLPELAGDGRVLLSLTRQGRASLLFLIPLELPFYSAEIFCP